MNDCKTIEELRERLPMYFGDLEKMEGKDHYHCKIAVNDYIDKMHIAQTLIRLCAIATHHDSQEISSLLRNRSIDINRMLELALQFMPTDIDELADELLRFSERRD